MNTSVFMHIILRSLSGKTERCNACERESKIKEIK